MATVVATKTDDVPTTTSGEQQSTNLLVPDYGAVGESDTVVVAAEGTEAITGVEVDVVTGNYRLTIFGCVTFQAGCLIVRRQVSLGRR